MESSPDGNTFRAIGRVAGAGTSTTPHTYQLDDAEPGRYASPAGYYRLRQVDQDSVIGFSPLRVVLLSTAATPRLTLYPNPTAGAAQLRELPPVQQCTSSTPWAG